MGLVYLYTGEGGGKTTAAFGAALRALGHGQKVVVIQFLKGRKDIGEWKIAKKLKPNYEIYQFGKKGWVSLKKPTEQDRQMAKEGLEFTAQVLKKKKPHVLILDEINLAAGYGLIKIEDLLALLKNIPARTTVFMTGRKAPKRLIARADFVAEMRQVKHPYYKGLKAVKGIQW